jgi:hypothetical protein
VGEVAARRIRIVGSTDVGATAAFRRHPARSVKMEKEIVEMSADELDSVAGGSTTLVHTNPVIVNEFRTANPIIINEFDKK